LACFAKADALFHRTGITFRGLRRAEGTERLIPFDIVPRIIAPASGDTDRARPAPARQRAERLPRDIYGAGDPQGGRRPGRAGAVQRPVPARDAGHRRAEGIYAHIAGIDVVRAAARAASYVLEDNLRVPSGVSYMLENRKVMMRLFPELFARYRGAPVEHYPDLLLEPAQRGARRAARSHRGRAHARRLQQRLLRARLPRPADGRRAGRGQDLFVRDETGLHAHHPGPQRVDVIYRRIDDDFLDPLAFRPDSTLGVPGLLGAYRAGRVTLANAIGTGVADDKSIYPYVPDMIRFYLGEEPLLANVPTWHPAAAGRPGLRRSPPGAARGQGGATVRAATAC
jgi:uncharacterized circularly permuted ATP-grasp superfamily protein